MRIDSSTLEETDWENWTRLRDLTQALATPPCPSLEGPVLEIGCGNGRLSRALAQIFDCVIPIDLQPRAYVERLTVADARALPFPNETFGLIFSSNVLEHIPQIDRAIQEMGRVAKKDAIMLHFMPTVLWKVLQFVLYPFELLCLQSRKYLLQETLSPHARLDLGLGKRGLRQGETYRGTTRWAKLWPPIHGASPTHRAELWRFRSRFWIDRFEKNGCVVLRVDPLYFHTAYHFFPFRGLALRDLVARHGLCTARAYWVAKRKA